MDLGIRGKVALVTGASSGIGEAVALELAREGVKLAVAARRREKLEDVARRARSLGAAEALALLADQTDEESLERLVREVESRLGAVEILIVNGGGPKPGTWTKLAPADWDAAYALTFRSALRLVDAVLPQMRKRGWGRVVALESVSVKDLDVFPDVWRVPEEFAPLVAFLCGEGARYVTGQTISIDGGRTAALFG